MWAPVSSMSSVVYDTQMQDGDAGSWVDQQQALPNPDPTAGKTIAWPLGSTYGEQIDYRVIPELASTIGATSNEAGVLTPVACDHRHRLGLPRLLRVEPDHRPDHVRGLPGRDQC